MRFSFKRILILVMMLLLPVQTFASAATLSCAFMHQDPVAAHQIAQMANSAELQDCHTPEQPDPPSAPHDCQHCSACYMASALAIPSIFVPPATARTQSAIVPFSSSSFIGYIPDSPERPPRPAYA